MLVCGTVLTSHSHARRGLGYSQLRRSHESPQRRHGYHSIEKHLSVWADANFQAVGEPSQFPFEVAVPFSQEVKSLGR